jgi:hypothetical protein
MEKVSRVQLISNIRSLHGNVSVNSFPRNGPHVTVLTSIYRFTLPISQYLFDVIRLYASQAQVTLLLLLVVVVVLLIL